METGELARRITALKNHLSGGTFAAGYVCGSTGIAVMGIEIQAMLDSTRVRSLRKNFALLQGAAKSGEPTRNISDAMTRDFDCLERRLSNLLAARRAGFRYSDFVSLWAKQGPNP